MVQLITVIALLLCKWRQKCFWNFWWVVNVTVCIVAWNLNVAVCFVEMALEFVCQRSCGVAAYLLQWEQWQDWASFLFTVLIKLLLKIKRLLCTCRFFTFMSLLKEAVNSAFLCGGLLLQKRAKILDQISQLLKVTWLLLYIELSFALFNPWINVILVIAGWGQKIRRSGARISLMECTLAQDRMEWFFWRWIEWQYLFLIAWLIINI